MISRKCKIIGMSSRPKHQKRYFFSLFDFFQRANPINKICHPIENVILNNICKIKTMQRKNTQEIQHDAFFVFKDVI
jgi:hypothetical protein